MNENELAGAPAPEQAPTAEPVAATDTPPEPETEGAAKSFTQEEVDAIFSKRLAKAQRKWDREQTQKAKSQPVPTEPLKADDFADAPSYADALAERKAQELLAKRDAEAERAATLDAYHDREEEARNKYDDFEQVAYNPKLPVTETMAQTIQATDNGPDVIYYLGLNPKEAERIARLSPLLQAREIGKIEANLGSNPPAKKTSTAPAPIAPVTARTSGAPAYDTTDPRSVKNMSTSEWIEAERLRQIKKYEAQRRR
jgi:hypothetical protein